MKQDNHGSLFFALKQSAPDGNVDKLNPGPSHQACGKYEVACWKGNKNDSPKGMTHGIVPSVRAEKVKISRIKENATPECRAQETRSWSDSEWLAPHLELLGTTG